MSTNQLIITDTGFSEEDLGNSKASKFFKLIFTKLSTISHVTLPNIGFNSFELKNNQQEIQFVTKKS
ncbi:MAG: hypothetical protein ACR2PU_03450 [Gammaproteobacteria bacterium]